MSSDYFERLVRMYKDVVAYHLRSIRPEQEVRMVDARNLLECQIFLYSGKIH